MSINVINRDGTKSILDISKIQKQTKEACEKFGMSQSELELDAQIKFQDGISTKDIQSELIKTAIEKTDIDVPNWTFVASELFLNDLYHEVGRKINGVKGRSYPKFFKYINYGLEKEVLNPYFSEITENELTLLNSYIDPKRDELYNYLGIKTMFDRYLLRDEKGEVFELPQFMFMAIGLFLAKNESDDLIEYNGQMIREKIYWAIQFYDLSSQLLIQFATPTLSNARKRFSQLNSCYGGVTPDNIEGIFESYKQMSLLSKFGGGIGWDWSLVRGSGSEIQKNPNTAGGTTPFLKITNDVAIAVDQLGTRKGAIAVYLEPWHIDLNSFLDLKKNSGEERHRAHDLFPSLFINDLFMERVQNDENWTLLDPYEAPQLKELYGKEFKKEYEKLENDENIKLKEVFKAKDLWRKILTSYFESGSPFLTFKDNANHRHMNEHEGIIRSSNLCTEIFENSRPDVWGVKVTLDNGDIIEIDEEIEVEFKNGFKIKAKQIINDYEIKIPDYDGEFHKVEFSEKAIVKEGRIFVCNLASVNLSKLNTKEEILKWVPIAMRALDNVIDINYYPVKQTKNFQDDFRGVGLGVMGEAEMLAVKQITWGTEEHYSLINETMEIISYATTKASCDLAKERGTFKTYEGSEWSKGKFPWESQSLVIKEDAEILAPEVIKVLNKSNIMDWESLRKDILEFGMRNAYLMAVAPTSTISILCGTTQAIEPIYKRKFNEENLSGLIPVVAPKLSPDTFQYYPTAYEVEQFTIIKAGVIRQKWIDQGQSLNIFITLDKASGKYLNDIYMLAWKLGLKSTYYLRSESPEAVQSDDTTMDRGTECVGCQ